MGPLPSGEGGRAVGVLPASVRMTPDTYPRIQLAGGSGKALREGTFTPLLYVHVSAVSWLMAELI